MNEFNLEYLHSITNYTLLLLPSYTKSGSFQGSATRNRFEANTPVQYSPLIQVVKSKTLVVPVFKVCD